MFISFFQLFSPIVSRKKFAFSSETSIGTHNQRSETFVLQTLFPFDIVFQFFIFIYLSSISWILIMAFHIDIFNKVEVDVFCSKNLQKLSQKSSRNKSCLNLQFLSCKNLHNQICCYDILCILVQKQLFRDDLKYIVGAQSMCKMSVLLCWWQLKKVILKLQIQND